jgi:hypothetical protein
MACFAFVVAKPRSEGRRGVQIASRVTYPLEAGMPVRKQGLTDRVAAMATCPVSEAEVAGFTPETGPRDFGPIALALAAVALAPEGRWATPRIRHLNLVATELRASVKATRLETALALAQLEDFAPEAKEAKAKFVSDLLVVVLELFPWGKDAERDLREVVEALDTHPLALLVAAGRRAVANGNAEPQNPVREMGNRFGFPYPVTFKAFPGHDRRPYDAKPEAEWETLTIAPPEHVNYRQRSAGAGRASGSETLFPRAALQNMYVPGNLVLEHVPLTALDGVFTEGDLKVSYSGAEVARDLDAKGHITLKSNGLRTIAHLSAGDHVTLVAERELAVDDLSVPVQSALGLSILGCPKVRGLSGMQKLSAITVKGGAGESPYEKAAPGRHPSFFLRNVQGGTASLAGVDQMEVKACKLTVLEVALTDKGHPEGDGISLDLAGGEIEDLKFTRGSGTYGIGSRNVPTAPADLTGGVSLRDVAIGTFSTSSVVWDAAFPLKVSGCQAGSIRMDDHAQRVNPDFLDGFQIVPQPNHNSIVSLPSTVVAWLMARGR